MLSKILLSTLLCVFFHFTIAQKSLQRVKSVGAMKAVGKTVFFAAADDTHGEELWVSDGSPDGTRMLKDISQGYFNSSPQQLISFKGQMFFTAYTPEFERELWKSDGTMAGTVMVTDLEPSGSYYGGSNPMALMIFKDYLYFTTSQGGLYKSDGTAAGTALVDELENSTIRDLTIAGNYLYYYKSGTELYRTDGASITTIPLPPDSEDTYFYSLHAAGQNLFAICGSSQYQLIQLYFFEQSTATWVLLKTYEAPIYGNQEIGNFTAVGDKLFFSFRSDYDNLPPTDELWVTDASINGTMMLKSFRWDPHWSQSEMGNFVVYKGELFFKSTMSVTSSLWRSDGTVPGTVEVHDVMVIPEYNYNNITPVVSGGKLWFCGDDVLHGGNAELWNTDGTTQGTMLYTDLDPQSYSYPYMLTAADDIVYFVTGNSYTGTTLWNTAAAPEIDILGLYGSPMANGSSLYLNKILVDDCLKFELTMQNTGYKELAVSHIQVTGSDFYLKGQLPELIEPGQKIVVDIYFNPLSREKKEGDLTIYSNDENEARYVIKLVGETLNSDARGICESFGNDFVKELRPSSPSKTILLSNTSAKEHLSAPSLVGMLSIPGFSGNVAYSLVSGKGDENNTEFLIEGNQLKANRSFDYSTKNVYVVRVSATTSETSKEEFFTVVVTDAPASLVSAPCPDLFEHLDYAFSDIGVNSLGHLYALTNNGRILHSADEGDSWNVIYSGALGHLNRIIFKNTTGYIVGDYTMLKSDDNGATWFQLYLPFKNLPKYYYSAFFLDALKGFVANNNGELLYTTDGGKTWESRMENQYSEIHDPWFWDSATGIAMNDRSGIVKTTDGGRTWEGVDVSGLGWSLQWTALWFINTMDGFLSSHEHLFRTKDGGETWSPVNEVSGSYIYGIVFTDDKNGYAYGGQFSPLLSVTKDGGNTWESTFENHGPGRVTGMAQSPSGKLFTVHMTNYSSSFSAGRAMNFSTDAGMTWSLLHELPDEHFRKVDFVSENVGFVYGETGHFKTMDKGITWKRMNWSRPIYSTHFFDENNALLSDGFVIYKTSDAGETMEEVLVTDQDPNNYVPAGNLYGVDNNLVFSFSTYALYRSLNGGTDWQLMNTDQTAYVQDMQFLSPTTGYRLGLFGHVQKSTDGGANWTEIFTPDPDSYDAYHTIFFVDANIGYKAGKLFRKTTDGGVTWTTIFTNFYGEIFELYFTDALHGYASGRAKVLYETFDGGLTWTEKWQDGSGDNLYDVQFKHGNIYLAGERGFLGQISNPGSAPLQAGYVYGRDVVCAGDVQVYHLAENYSGTYRWNVAGGTVSDYGSSAYVQFQQPGEYTFTVNNLNNCGISESRMFSVTAVELSEPVIAGPEFINSEAANIRYDITNPESGVAYAWDVTGAKNFTSENTDHTLVNWESGAEDAGVRVIATEPVSGCRVSGGLTVTVDIILGLVEESLDISVYPNPTAGEVKIQSGLSNTLLLKVYDLMGREYHQQELGPFQESTLQLRHIPAGLYFLEMSDSSGKKITTKKIIKK